MHLLYLASDDQLSERLMRVTSATSTHLRGIDLIKNDFRCFVCDRLFWAMPVTCQDEQDTLYYLLYVRAYFNAP
jgi:predicted DNA-binding transcriptional regulator YafY